VVERGLLQAEDRVVEAAVLPTDLEGQSALQELIRCEWEEPEQEELGASVVEQVV
jgi:hypothetical protein